MLRYEVAERRGLFILAQPQHNQRYQPIKRPDKDVLTQRIISRDYGCNGYLELISSRSSNPS